MIVQPTLVNVNSLSIPRPPLGEIVATLIAPRDFKQVFAFNFASVDRFYMAYESRCYAALWRESPIPVLVVQEAQCGSLLPTMRKLEEQSELRQVGVDDIGLEAAEDGDVEMGRELLTRAKIDPAFAENTKRIVGWEIIVVDVHSPCT